MSGNLYRLPIMIVALVIGIIMVTAVILPLSSEYSEDKTFTNKPRYYVDTTIDDEVTITMDYDIDGTTRTWYIDGEPLVYDLISGGAEFVNNPTVTGTDNYVFRTDGRCRGLSNGTGASDFTLTVTDSSITNGTYVGNAPLFVASTTETEHIMRYSPNTTDYILNTSDIIACGYTNVTYGNNLQTNLVIAFTGNMEDGLTFTTYDAYDPTRTYEVTDVQIDADAVSGYNDLYTFNAVKFNVTYDDGDDEWTTACTYSMVVLPSEVSASTDNPAAYKALVMVIPLMAFVVLVVAAAAMIYYKKD